MKTGGTSSARGLKWAEAGGVWTCVVSPWIYSATDGASRLLEIKRLNVGARILLEAVRGFGGALIDQHLADHVDVIPCCFGIDAALQLARLPPLPRLGVSVTDPIVDRCLGELQRARYTLTVGDMAVRMRASTRTITRAFVRATGLPPREHLVAMRSALRDFLLRAALPLGEVSDLLGYGSPADFSHAVKAATGLSPRELRSILNSTALATASARRNVATSQVSNALIAAPW